MSEKSFAVASVSTAIICGVFFYPDPVARPAVSAAPAAPVPRVAAVAVERPAALVQTRAADEADAFLGAKHNLVPLASH